MELGRTIRLKWIRIVLGIVFIVQVMLSFALWHSERFLKPIPILPGFDRTLQPFDEVLLVSLILVPLFFILGRRPKYSLLILPAICILLVLGDLNRLQPWVYQYILMMGILAYITLRESKTEVQQKGLNALRLLFVGTYFWAGIQKLNVTFLTETVPWMLSPFVKDLSDPVINGVGLAAALSESGIGVALLFPRSRSWGIAFSFFMHLALLVALGPLGHHWNSIIWPWNAIMPVFVGLLFWKAKETPREILFQKSVPHALIAFACFIPLLSFFDRCDSFLSFKLYSGNSRSGFILFDPAEEGRFPENIQKIAHEGVFSLLDWSMVETNVPAYPEKRYYKAVAKNLCKLLGFRAGIELRIIDIPDGFTGQSRSESFSCLDLEN